jgi:hypothetical protein
LTSDPGPAASENRPEQADLFTLPLGTHERRPLFIGQLAEFFAVMSNLAQAADAARHGTS